MCHNSTTGSNDNSTHTYWIDRNLLGALNIYIKQSLHSLEIKKNDEKIDETSTNSNNMKEAQGKPMNH